MRVRGACVVISVHAYYGSGGGETHRVKTTYPYIIKKKEPLELVNTHLLHKHAFCVSVSLIAATQTHQNNARIYTANHISLCCHNGTKPFLEWDTQAEDMHVQMQMTGQM